MAKLFSNAKLSSVSNDGCGKRFVHTLLTWLLAFIGSVWAADPIFLDDFNDDAGDLTGESANTGQEWAWHTADWSQGPLVVGRRYGQDGSLGAGYRQTAVEPAWRANQVAIGETIRSGSWVLTVDVAQQNGALEPNIALESGDGTEGVTIIWSGSQLKCGGNIWSGQLDMGRTEGNMRFELELKLDPDRPQNSTASIRYMQLDNPSVQGRLDVGRPKDVDPNKSGGFEFARLTLAAASRSNARIGFDNITLSPGPMLDSDRTLHIGSRRELFVDDYLIDQLDGARLTLGTPQDEGVVFSYDQPWEGRYSGYGVMMKLAEDNYRYYYRGSPRIIDTPRGKDVEKQNCIAISKDGIHWDRPQLDRHAVNGNRENNIFFKDELLSHNFAPFLDRPGTTGPERFKAVAGERFTGVVVFSSADGLDWNQMFDGQPVMQGKYLDAMNVAFWSEAEQLYVFYGRIWKKGWSGTRWIARATSEDLQHWTPLEEVRILHDGEDVPVEHYYHSGISQYFRAPHIYIALCSQITNGQVLRSEQVATLDVENPGRAKSRSGGGLITSRGGNIFDRSFMEEFIRPPIGPENWIARCNYPVVGVVQTGEAEMSLYVDIHSGQPTRAVRRYALRLDGFASLEAPFAGGEMVTKPFQFKGKQLSINYATSSRGFLQMQFETPAGSVIDGFTLDTCETIVGNEIEHIVRFNGSSDLSALAAKPVRLKVRMKDANLYSIQFQE